MTTMLALVWILLATWPAWTGHDNLPSTSLGDMEWFCTPEVAFHLHSILPVRISILRTWSSQNTTYVTVQVYSTPLETPVAESVHAVIEEGLGPIVFFQTLPDGRILCNRLPPKDS